MDERHSIPDMEGDLSDDLESTEQYNLLWYYEDGTEDTAKEKTD